MLRRFYKLNDSVQRFQFFLEQGKPLAHAGLGWEELTDRLMLRVLQERNPTVFMLWGAWAQKKAALIEEHKKGEVLILQANHPSPLSARRPLQDAVQHNLERSALL